MELFHIDFVSRVPIYEQLYKRVVELVLKGELKPNDKLPPIRDIASELGVNPNTVSKAFSKLEADGIIYSMVGRGTFIREPKTDAIRQSVLKKFADSVTEAANAGFTEEELVSEIKRIMGGNKNDQI